MSELYNTIAELCKKRDITVTELCRASGVSRAALSDLKMERKKSLSTKSLSKIADYLHVPMEYLLGMGAKASARPYTKGRARHCKNAG